jgi:hypothetical protein
MKDVYKTKSQGSKDGRKAERAHLQVPSRAHILA